MHHAPALALTLQPDRLWLRVIRTFSLSALLAAGVWLAWHATQTGMPTGTMLLLPALCSLPALWLLGTAAAVGCDLSWCPEEARWCLQPHPSNGQTSPPRPGRIECVADGTHWMLLRHTGRGIPSVWLCVSRRAHPGCWHALRCAIFSPGVHIEPVPVPDE
ncbi:hypothetical protein [Sphaerotilus sp.]|uniref:hypothetical protein n=1 Tax=Sphaerotilus sp. TaxID=2093942 RepID=UPI0034E1D95A